MQDCRPPVHSVFKWGAWGRSDILLTRRSVPDFFKFAQSSGPCPGAKATFFEAFLGALVVLGGTAKEEAPGGTRRDEDATDGPDGTPGLRAARPGSGGGGMSSVSVRTRGMGELDKDVSLPARWALFRLGKAGGISLDSSSDPRTVAASSSSSSAGANSTISGGAGVVDVMELRVGTADIQFRR